MQSSGRSRARSVRKKRPSSPPTARSPGAPATPAQRPCRPRSSGRTSAQRLEPAPRRRPSRRSTSTTGSGGSKTTRTGNPDRSARIRRSERAVRSPREIGEESPNSVRAACRVTPGRGDAKESATEKRPPSRGKRFGTARVKRCGKSAPLLRQRRGHGKPHAEQGQIGRRRAPVPSRFRAGRLRVGCLSPRETSGREE